MSLNLSKDLIPLSELLGKVFFIPSYQRGYRWRAEYEVNDLLGDLYEFFKTEATGENSFYCLQPLVVNLVSKDGLSRYNVVDGQQRLTTFFLIYKFLHAQNMCNIEYETRTKSAHFLMNIENQDIETSSSNIDYNHFYEAYIKIVEWFDDEKIKLFKDYFLTKTMVIWYELEVNEIEIEVFLRLNIGKIPLTNAELIKAIFLSKSSETDYSDLKDRAKIWYDREIETRRDHDKAYCLYNNLKSSDIVIKEVPELNDDISRVEMFFHLLSGDVPNSSEEPHALFKHFYELTKAEDKSKIWKEFKEKSATLLTIANPTSPAGRSLYHYLGFLIACDKPKKYSRLDFYNDIKQRVPQPDLIDKLKNIIVDRYKNVVIDDLSFLDYKQKKQLQELLLLFNLQDLVNNQSDNKNFAFNRYKLQEWTLEHVIPQNPKNIDEYKNIQVWINDLKKFFDDEDEICSRLDRINERNYENYLPELEELIRNHEYIHSISNLVLLDKDSNARLSNNDFGTKRQLIERIMGTPKLVPQCTGYVFIKRYSFDNIGDPHYWTTQDRQNYLNELHKVLAEFIHKENLVDSNDMEQDNE